MVSCEGRFLVGTVGGKTVRVRADSVSAVVEVTAETTQVFFGAESFTVAAPLSDVVDVLDPPAPTVVPTPAPEGDLTLGRLRMSPIGYAVAYELQPGHPKGDWCVVSFTGLEMSTLFVTNETNPEINDWPPLRTGE